LSRSGRERYRFLTMPSSPKLSGVPEYGLAVFLDVLIEPNAGGRWPVSMKTDRKGERSFCDDRTNLGKFHWHRRIRLEVVSEGEPPPDRASAHSMQWTRRRVRP
jgi:hypothetical protein